MDSKRQEIKRMIADLRCQNPQVDVNIFRAAENVNLETVISYYKGEEQHSFLDTY